MLEERYLAWLKHFLPPQAGLDEAALMDRAHTAAALRQSSPWREQIPEALYQSYVLPLFVNNEPLVLSLEPFLSFLGPLDAGLSLYDAAVTVNYRCRAAAQYRFNDAITASPLIVLLRGYGRCGELSTLTVLCLRAVGIPARQVYTPLWAHCDDNHAWVEAYTGEGWHYLGGCEAEPTLDRAWFDFAVTRAPFIRTTADAELESFDSALYGGNCVGSEGKRLVIDRTKAYADTTALTLRIQKGGRPVPRQQISLCLLNAGALRPFARLVSDLYGVCRINLGRGSCFVTAHDKEGEYLLPLPLETAGETADYTFLMDEALSDGSLSLTQLPPKGRMLHAAPPPTPAERARGEAADRAFAARNVQQTDWQYPSDTFPKGACRLQLSMERPLHFSTDCGLERQTDEGFALLPLHGSVPMELQLPCGRWRSTRCTRRLDGSMDASLYSFTLSEAGLALALDPPPDRKADFGKGLALAPPYAGLRRCYIACLGETGETNTRLEAELKAYAKTAAAKDAPLFYEKGEALPQQVREALGVGDPNRPLLIAVVNGQARAALANAQGGALRLLMEFTAKTEEEEC